MAVAIFKLHLPRKPTFFIRSLLHPSQKGKVRLFLPSSQSSHKHQNLSTSAVETVDETEFIIEPTKSQNLEFGGEVKEWRKLSSRELGISTAMISGYTRTVLKELSRNGFEVYLVGGCVRDLILKRVPKDFDVLTTAELREIISIFPHSEIVGRRFPICHVHIDDSTVEVSSFKTRQRTCSRKMLPLRAPSACDEKDKIRWRNCMERDFTINGLLI